jgi:hypothetical protein
MTPETAPIADRNEIRSKQLCDLLRSNFACFVDLDQRDFALPVATIKIIGATLMRTHFKIVGAAVGGILASCLAFQTPGHSQGTAATRDCEPLLQAYYDVGSLIERTGMAAGVAEGQHDLNEAIKRRDNAHAYAEDEYYEAERRLDPKSKTYAADKLNLSAKKSDRYDTANDDYEERRNEIEKKYRAANPELNSLWRAYIDCRTKQAQAERQALEALYPPLPGKTKLPETPPTNTEDQQILDKVRVAPDPDKELQTLWQGAEAEINAILEDMAQPADKPRKKRSRTKTGDGDGGRETTQKHDPDTSTAMIMLLGTAAGIAADRLRQGGSGGGGDGGGSGGGGKPVKPGSGGCSGGACPRPR